MDAGRRFLADALPILHMLCQTAGALFIDFLEQVLDDMFLVDGARGC